PGAFAPQGKYISLTDNLGAFAYTLANSYAWAPAIVGIGALGLFCVRPIHETRTAWILLAVSWLACGPILTSRFDVELDDRGIYVVQRFHLMSVLLLAIPIAVALDRIAMRIHRPAFDRYARAARIGLPLVVFVAMTARSLPYVARFHSPAAERSLENMLTTLPPNAVVLGAPDIYHFGLNYMQEALRLRRDVLVITTPQLKLDFHRERVQERSGVTIEPDLKRTMNVPLVEKLLATGRPVFIDRFQLTIVQSFPTYPYGLLFRVLPRGTRTPPTRQVYDENVALFEKFKFGYPLPGHHDEVASEVHNVYAMTWHTINVALEKEGDLERAEDAHRRAQVLAPEND
ncbi:MAG: hypothetical protein ACKV2T_40290, partial [Kofleriaceae bacterium]